jgi:putative CocE/NonD family hydrolase
MALDGAMMREALEFGLALARGIEPPAREAVRLWVMGAETWRDFPSWPPPGYSPRPFYLGPDGSLGAEPPSSSDVSPDEYRYDPADPTPAVGGVRMVRDGAGRVEQAALEARADVLTYTTPPLASDLEVIGEVSAQIWVRSSVPYADVFVRLCDVDPDGRSWNVCDGLVSLSGADQAVAATVRLWPTAYRFAAGHRIRVQVASGSFPRYARNPGTGEPRATATRLVPADQAVFHDHERPSAIMLPVRAADASS